MVPRLRKRLTVTHPGVTRVRSVTSGSAWPPGRVAASKEVRMNNVVRNYI